jgi:two-component system, NtrC family, sensor histidine kinase KinB
MQLLVSHLLLVLLMVVIMVGAIINFFSLGSSIGHILKDNYKSVVAAQTMSDALERMDSSAAFVLAGQTKKAKTQYRTNLQRFAEAYRTESNNITESGEKTLVDDIGRQFTDYHVKAEKLIFADHPLPTSEARAVYFNQLEPEFLHLKQLSQDVLNLNQAAIVRADARAESEARGASWRSIGITLAAFLLALFFAIRMIHITLDPILSFAKQAEEIGGGNLEQHIEIHRSDEVGVLADSFNHMVVRLREARHILERQLHLAQRMSDEALTSLYDPVIVTDASGRIVHLNKAAEGLFGSVGHVVGMLVDEVIEAPEIVKEIERAIRQEEHRFESDAVPLRIGDTTRTYYPRATPMHDDDGTLLGAVAVMEDVTHLSELDRLKTEFIGIASHELRTPVASLLLSAELLEEGAAGELSQKQREIVGAQLQDLHRMDSLIQELLDITRLEMGSTPPRFEIVSVSGFVETALASMLPQAKTKGIAIEKEFHDLPLWVRVDPAQMSRVIVNLLNNAVRYTESGGTVILRIKSREANVLIEVEDTGAGIPEQYLKRVFERFVQVPGTTGGGAGMGLSIAQTIVTAHGGTIWAESEMNKGSKFVVSLPSIAKT